MPASDSKWSAREHTWVTFSKVASPGKMIRSCVSALAFEHGRICPDPALFPTCDPIELVGRKVDQYVG